MSELARVAPREGTVASLVRELTGVLAAGSIEDAGREARDIVAAVHGEARFWAALHENELVRRERAEDARRAAGLRLAGAPFAYAVGVAPFRHLTLHVDERVLIPRQETEQLVEEVLARATHGLAVDIGTGSGAIALALASEGHFDRVIGTDVSRGALAVAEGNAARLVGELRAPVEFRQGALFAPLAGVPIAIKDALCTIDMP